jgi:cell wall-associated NlpC family hydrolase
MLALLAQGASADGKFSIGDRVWTTADTNLNVREEPGTSSLQIDSLIKGSVGSIIEGPISQDGYNWWNIIYDVGTTGWSAEDWLQKSPADPQQPTDFAMWSENAIKWGENHTGSEDWWDEVNKQGYCLRFVANAFMQKYAEGQSVWNSPVEAAAALYRFDQEPGGWVNAPRGAIVIFDKEGKNNYGHVGIYLGAGRILHAHGTVQDTTVEDAMAYSDVGNYLGWSYPPEAWRQKTATTSQPVQTTEGTQEPSNTLDEATLTLYVHDGSASGSIIQGARVTGQDGSGTSFEQTTDSNGYVTITGYPGTWSFSVSAEGYETNSWDQEITDTCTKHAFLQKEQPVMRTNEYIDNSTAISCTPGSKRATCPSAYYCVDCNGKCIPPGADSGRGWSCDQGKWDYNPRSLADLGTYRGHGSTVTYDSDASMIIANVRYDKGVQLKSQNYNYYYSLFNLDRAYSHLTGLIGLDDRTATSSRNVTVTFSGDDVVLQNFELHTGDFPVDVDIDVGGVGKLTVGVSSQIYPLSVDLIYMDLT